MASPKPAATGTVGKTLVRAAAGLVPVLIPAAVAVSHSKPVQTPVTPPAITSTMNPGSGGAAATLTGVHCGGGTMDSPACPAPYPMLSKGHPVDWWFVFKFNAGKFPLCGSSVAGGPGADSRTCPFGAAPNPAPIDPDSKLPSILTRTESGAPLTEPSSSGKATIYQFGQRYAMASSEAPTLAAGGSDCLGDTTGDPVGATFDEVYHGNFHYVVWNDQFYGDPSEASCSGDGCDAPWGHSKGMLAWNDAGEGMVMQVSTPSWPASGSAAHPRLKDGNTLGCVTDPDVKVSQHFFALHLTEPDVEAVLTGLNNASVVTKNLPQIQSASTGGPAKVQALVSTLGTKSKSADVFTKTLSSGVELISKPSALNVPPWQMISSLLGGVGLRAATWWADPQIPTTTATTTVACWEAAKQKLPQKPGPVEIATGGVWNKVEFNLAGGPNADDNHAKVGVSTTAGTSYAIFGDENQQGVLSPIAADPSTKTKAVDCDSSQNGRGGTFYVMQNPALWKSLGELIAGTTAPQ